MLAEPVAGVLEVRHDSLVLERVDGLFTRFFLRHVDLQAARESLPEAGELRIADPNVTDAERECVRRLTRRV